MNIIEAYREQINKYSTNLESVSKKANLWSGIRFVSFILFVAGFILLIQYNLWVAVVAFYLLAFAFIKIVKQHIDITNKRDQLKRCIDNSTLEIKYIEEHKTDRDSGGVYLDPLHPYSSDLDIFGEQSMFQFIERCNTKIGKDKLAERFLNKLKPEEILRNQESVSELSNSTNWSQAFFAHEIKKDDSTFNPKLIQHWLDFDDSWIDNIGFKIASFILPIFSGMLAWYLGSTYGLYYGLLAFIPNALLLKKYHKHIVETQNRIDQTLRYVAKYAPLFAEIESAEFKNANLLALQSRLKINNKSSEKQLKNLDWYLDQLQMKYNFFGMAFNILTMWDFHFMRKVFAWKKQNGNHIYDWLNSLSEFEFLNSLATLKRNNPSWSFPEIKNDGNVDAVELGHPLIHPNKMIANTVQLPTSAHVKLITGSNMGGKSTFLRTIGLNLVLSYMGSSVSAKKFSAPILDVISSMRTSDALQENTSGFYAELKRLKLILDRVKNSQGNFFLIDEVLKGTNTKDRHEGSKALIKQLIDNGGAGLISTHDLELAALEEKLQGKLENKCFEVEVKEDKLIFDYKIKDGVSQSFNATQLMRNMGIEI